MRFREYLGAQYSNKENKAKVKAKVKGKNKEVEIEREIQLPIYCLYILGEDAGIGNIPVVKVNPVAHDVATGNIIQNRNDFIESLHHCSWIIQIKWLKDRRRTELEQLLSVFDQANRTSDIHIMNVREEDFPEKYRPLIRRLKMAASSPEIKEQMKAEDQYLAFIKECIRSEAAKMELEIAESKAALAEKDAALAENKAALAENKAALAEKEAALAEKEAIIAERDQEVERMKAFILKSGLTYK